MSSIPDELKEALKQKVNYGRSVADILDDYKIHIQNSPFRESFKNDSPECELLSIDPCPFTLTKKEHAMFLAVMSGLNDIFTHDRRTLADPRWLDPSYQDLMNKSNG